MTRNRTSNRSIGRDFERYCPVDKSGIFSGLSRQSKPLCTDTQMSDFVSKSATIRIAWAICCQLVRKSWECFAKSNRIPVPSPSVTLGWSVCSQIGLLSARLLYWLVLSFSFSHPAQLILRFRPAQDRRTLILAAKTLPKAANPLPLPALQFQAVA